MKKKISMKTIYLLAVIAVGLVGLGVGSTYAVFTASATIDNPIAFTSNLSSTNEIIDTTSVNIGANETKTITLKVVNTTSSTLNYAAWYNADLEGLAIGVSSDSSNKATGTIAKGVTKAIDIIIKNGSTNTTTIQFGVSSSVDQISLGTGMRIINSVIESDRANAVRFIVGISDLYSNTGNFYDGFEATYDIDEDHNLMVDSGNNLRYYGTSPNNYVKFNCREYPDTGCEIWRIVGIIDNKIKLIKNSPLEILSWDYVVDATGNSSFRNDWESSSLLTLLNKHYADGLDVVESPTNLGTNVTLDMTQVGLKNDETRAMLDYEESMLYLGGVTSGDMPAAYAYQQERDAGQCLYNQNIQGTPISIPYLSDYGLAVDYNQCQGGILMSQYTGCAYYNWMSGVFTEAVSSEKPVWLMTTYANDTEKAMYVSLDLSVASDGRDVESVGAVYPTVYLNDGVLMVDGDGDGTASNPYKLYAG